MYMESGERDAGKFAQPAPGLRASDTMPMRGLQYMTSPALPDPTRKGIAPQSGIPSAMVTMTSSYGRLQPLSVTTASMRGGTHTSATAADGRVEDPASTFAETLASIGPSARRLLMLDAEERLGDDGDQYRRGTHASSTPGTLPHAGKGSGANKGSGARTYGTGARLGHSSGSGMNSGRTSPEPDALHHRKGQTLTASLDGTLSRTRNARRNSSKATSRDGSHARAYARTFTLPAAKVQPMEANAVTGSQLARDPRTEPPLVRTLRKYLEREVHLVKDGVPVPSALDQLGAYREAFGALISAFPGYSPILGDIKSAYENVIQLQAELLTEAYAQDQQRNLSAVESKAALGNLQKQIGELEMQLRQAHSDMANRDVQLREELAARQQVSSAGTRANNFELRRQLERSEARIEQLEAASKSDLQKILVLISAVRECDKRIKKLEGSVDFMSGQVEELDEFKRLAGEAQGELLRYTEKYRAFVPACDFEAMKEYLVAELASAQDLVKRLRRTAAVRGTQLDVMKRRVMLLEAEAAPEVREAMTPRPQWKELEEQLPDLEAFALPIHSNPLPTLNGPTSPPAIPGGEALANAAAQAEPASATPENEDTASAALDDAAAPGSEVLIVQGPDTTHMRIGFLIERIKGMYERMQQLERENQSLSRASRQNHAEETAEGRLGTPRGSGDHLNSSRSHLMSRTSLGNSFVNSGASFATTSGRAMKRRSIMVEGMEAGPLGHGVPTIRPLPMPLIGPGMTETIPAHIRCSGLVQRTVVDVDVGVLLVYEFFVRVLKPMTEEDTSSPFAVTAARIPSRYHAFLTHVLEVGGLPKQPNPAAAIGDKSMGGGMGGGGFLGPSTTPLSLPFECAAHLALNLEEDARDVQLTNPALLLHSYILRGVMPLRLAVEAVTIVERVVEDLCGLAAEAQKQRLQRSAINECLLPILELRSLDELAELRAALGTDATFDVVSLTSMKNRFLRTIFFQECIAGITFYAKLVGALTEAASDRSKLPPNVSENCEDGDFVISLDSVALALMEVEPLTPAVVVRELSENALVSAKEAGQRDDDDDDSGNSVTQVVRLSEVLAAVDEAPIIRRTRLTSAEECML